MLAEHLVSSGDLEMYVPEEHPDRPADIPFDDEALYVLLRKASAAGGRRKLAREDADAAESYRSWVSMLQRAEARTKARLSFLAGCWKDLRREAQDQYLQSCAGRIRGHVERYWPGVDLDKLPPTTDPAARDGFLSRACRRHDLVATWVIEGGRPPRYVPPQQ